MNRNSVEVAYDFAPEREWRRLEVHRLEFEVAKRNLRAFLSPASLILDVGGGPGRYAITLARDGHEVTLADLSSACLELAREKARQSGATLKAFVHTDACELSAFKDDDFDAVLCMGPLYHLLEESGRVQTVNECLRVLKPEGRLFATFITSYAPLIRYVRKNPEALGQGYDPRAYLPSGTHRSDAFVTGVPDAHFVHPFAVQPFMESFGLETLKVTGLEGVAMGREQALNALPAETFARWVDLTYETASDPVTWGASEHLLYVGRKPACGTGLQRNGP